MLKDIPMSCDLQGYNLVVHSILAFLFLLNFFSPFFFPFFFPSVYS